MTKVEAPKQWGHLLRVDLAVGWWWWLWWWWDFFFANNTGALHQTTFWKVPQCQQIPAKRHILIRNTHSQFDFVCWWACPVLPSKHVLLSKSFVLLKLRLQHDATFSLKYSLSPVVPFHFPSKTSHCSASSPKHTTPSPATLDPWVSYILVKIC